MTDGFDACLCESKDLRLPLEMASSPLPASPTPVKLNK